MIPRKSCRACLLLVTFSCSIPGWAQPTPPGRVFTLAEASRQALEGHPSLVAAGQRIRVAEGTRIGSAKRPNPKLLVSGENFPLGSTEGGFEFGRSLEWNVVFSQPFELSGKRAKRARIADYGVRSSTSDLETRRRAILAEVRRAYEAGLYAKADHSLLKENRQNYSELVRFAEVRVSEGFTAEGDLIKLRLESRVADYEIELARVRYEASKIRLLRAVGSRTFETGFELEPLFEFRPVDLSAAELRNRVLLRPDVEKARILVEQARAQLDLERVLSRPDLVPGLGYKRNGPDNTWTASLTFDLPLSNKNEGGIAQALAEISLYEAELKVVEGQVFADLAEAEAALRSARAQVELLHGDFLSRATETYTVAEVAYREGAADLLVLLEAQRSLTGARRLYNRAVADHRFAVRALEAVLGGQTLGSAPSGSAPPPPGSMLDADSSPEDR